MVRGLIAGMTDYSQQSLEDMVADLREWESSLLEVCSLIRESIKALEKVGYWETVQDDFKSLTYYSLKFFETSIVEIREITTNLHDEVKEHHIKRIRFLFKTAHGIYKRFGSVWHKDYFNKDYSNKDFKLVEGIYIEGRSMVADILDLSNLAQRLEDFIGRSAIKTTPIKMKDIQRCLWVLESEDDICQGTGFSLDGFGIVTCHHVIAAGTYAFRTSNPTEKFKVSVKRQSAAIDLAIVEIEGYGTDGLPIGNSQKLDESDSITIVGYPNYRLGDTGTVVPGQVAGFRMVSGIRRILTNAPIIAGNSGGPVFNAEGKVIGIAVTGADRMENAQQTEDHGIIPINALYLEW